MLNAFFRAALEALLWSEHDDDDEGLEALFDSLEVPRFKVAGDALEISQVDEDAIGIVDPSVLTVLFEDCKAFLSRVEAWDAANAGPHGQSLAVRICGPDAERAGHDFVLTRNEHGAGFWDGDWDSADWPDCGDVLTAIAKASGTLGLYLGNNGRAYPYPNA